MSRHGAPAFWPDIPEQPASGASGPGRLLVLCEQNGLLTIQASKCLRGMVIASERLAIAAGHHLRFLLLFLGKNRKKSQICVASCNHSLQNSLCYLALEKLFAARFTCERSTHMPYCSNLGLALMDLETMWRWRNGLRLANLCSEWHGFQGIRSKRSLVPDP